MTRIREGHSLTELGEQLRQAALEHPTVTRCLWCDWTHTGTAQEGMGAALAHRQAAHGVRAVPSPKKRNRPHNAPVLAGDLEANLAATRAQGGASWMDTAA